MLFVAVAVTGLVELVKRLEEKDYYTALVIFGAALVGAVAGYFQVEGLSVTEGVIAGLGASGLVKIASKVG